MARKSNYTFALHLDLDNGDGDIREWIKAQSNATQALKLLIRRQINRGGNMDIVQLAINSAFMDPIIDRTMEQNVRQQTEVSQPAPSAVTPTVQTQPVPTAQPQTAQQAQPIPAPDPVKPVSPQVNIDDPMAFINHNN